MNIFSFIKTQVNILDLVQTHTTLKKTGLYWKGVCPFHTEKTASFTVSPHKEIFYCFGCHAHGDVISFIAQTENCSPQEAVQFLIDRYNITVPDSVQHTQEQSTTHQYYEVCQQIALWCQKELASHPSAQLYLKKRNITRAGMDYFSIGYFPGGLHEVKRFIHALQEKSILVNDLIQSSILLQGKNMLYSPFEERIVFPIKDHLGRHCGFGGRTFKPTDSRVKYYNSHETAFFNKRKLLFGLDLAKKSIQQKSSAFLVEGYTDCIAMIEHGYKNTIATLGTACSVEHLQQLSRYAQELIVVYDGDLAGQQALLRLTELCWQATLDLKVIQLPKGQDPASFLSSNQLKPLLDNAQDIISFFITTTGRDFSQKGLAEKLQSVKKITNIICKLDDPVKQDILLKKASTYLDIPFESLKKSSSLSVKNSSQPHYDGPKKHTIGAKKQDDSIQKLSKKIFFAIIQNVSLVQTQHVDFLSTFLPDPLRGLLTKLKDLQKKQAEPVRFSTFFDVLQEEDQKIVSKLILEMEDEPSSEALEELINELQKKQWKITVQHIKSKLEQAKRDENQQEIKHLLEELINLKKRMIGKNLI